MTREQRLRSLHVVEPDGARTSAGEALARLAELLPGAAPAARLGRTRLGRAATERGYRLVSRHRHALSRLVPDRSAVRRWRS